LSRSLLSYEKGDQARINFAESTLSLVFSEGLEQSFAKIKKPYIEALADAK